MGMTQQFFIFFVPGDLGLWPLTLTFQLRPDFCTMYLTATFDRPMFSRSEVMARTNILTNWQTNKQTPLKTSTALRYATSEDKNLRRRLSSFVELRHVTGVQLLLLVINSLTGVVQLCRLRCSCIVLGTIHSDVVRRSLTAPRIHCAPRSCHLATDRASVPRPIRAGVFSLNDDDNGKVLEKKKRIREIYWVGRQSNEFMILCRVLRTTWFSSYTHPDDYNASLFKLFPEHRPKLDSQVAWIINKNCSSLRSIRTQVEKM